MDLHDLANTAISILAFIAIGGVVLFAFAVALAALEMLDGR